MYILIIAIILIGGGWLAGKMLGQILFPETKETGKEPPFIINNYINETHNHLHVDKETIKELSNKK